MLQHDRVAVAVLRPGRDDLAVTGGMDRGAAGSGKVDALVRTPRLQERVKSRQRESGGNSGKRHRRAHKSLAQALAVLGVVSLAGILPLPEKRTIDPVLVDEFRSDDPS